MRTVKMNINYNFLKPRTPKFRNLHFHILVKHVQKYLKQNILKDKTILCEATRTKKQKQFEFV